MLSSGSVRIAAPALALLVLAVALAPAAGFSASGFAFSGNGIVSVGKGGVTSAIRSTPLLRTRPLIPGSAVPGDARLRGSLVSGLRMAEESSDGEKKEESEEPAAEASEAAEEAGEEDGMDLNSPEFLARKVEILEKELADAQQRVTELEADAAPLADLVSKNLLKKPSAVELKDTYIRLAADFDNFRRRSATDLDNAKNSAMSSVLKELLTVLDNFELASGAVTAETDKEQSIKKSYEAINKQLLTAMSKLGVTPIEPLGAEFDPNIHNAIQQAESEEYAEGVVCKALQRGYQVGPQVLRAALVVVSAGPGPAGGAEPAAEPAAEAEAPAEEGEPAEEEAK